MPFLTLNNLFHIPNYSTFSAKGKNFYQNKRKIPVKSSINVGKTAREGGLRRPGIETKSVLLGNAPSQVWSKEGLSLVEGERTENHPSECCLFRK